MGLLRLLKKAKYKLFPIKEYINGVHYELTNDARYLLSIKVLKGMYTNAQVGFEAANDGNDGRLAIRTKLIKWSYFEPDFTTDQKWCIIAADIFQAEFETAMNNYRNIREEVLHDEDDRTDNFEESFPQRTVYTKGNPVSKKRVLSRQKRKATVSGDARVHSKVQPPADHGSDSDIFGSEG